MSSDASVVKCPLMINSLIKIWPHHLHCEERHFLNCFLVLVKPRMAKPKRKILLSLAQPIVLQWVSWAIDDPDGCRQIGLTKSEGISFLSSFSRTTVLPSTGLFIMPMMCRSCCQGLVDAKRVLPARAIHSALLCLWEERTFINFDLVNWPINFDVNLQSSPLEARCCWNDPIHRD